MKSLNVRAILAFGMIAALLIGCGKKNDVSLEEGFASYVASDQNVVAFGSINLMGILEKADYKNIPKFGPIVSQYIGEISSALNLKSGVYVALKGPFKADGSPEEVIVFMEVKNQDSLKSMALRQGYDISENDDFSYFRDNDVSLATSGKIAAVLIKGGDFEEVEVLSKIMAATQEGTDDVNLRKRIKSKGDIHLVNSLANMYHTLNAKNTNQSENLKKEMTELVKDGYIDNTVYFEQGRLRMKTVNYFSAALQKRKIFQVDPGASVAAQLGGGAPSVALATNIDMRQMQAWVEDFTNQSLDELASEMGGPVALALTFAGGKVYNLLNGKLGFAMYADAKPMEGVTPEFSLYAGFGPNGKGVAELAKNQMSGSELDLKVTQGGLMASSKNAPKSLSKITIPNGCEKFGQGGLTLFANFEKMDVQSFELEGAAKMLNLAKYLTLYFDQTGGEIVIQMKNPKVNVLKQSADFLLEEFASQISNVAI